MASYHVTNPHIGIHPCRSTFGNGDHDLIGFGNMAYHEPSHRASRSTPLVGHARHGDTTRLPTATRPSSHASNHRTGEPPSRVVHVTEDTITVSWIDGIAARKGGV